MAMVEERIRHKAKQVALLQQQQQLQEQLQHNRHPSVESMSSMLSMVSMVSVSTVPEPDALKGKESGEEFSPASSHTSALSAHSPMAILESSNKQHRPLNSPLVTKEPVLDPHNMMLKEIDAVVFYLYSVVDVLN